MSDAEESIYEPFVSRKWRQAAAYIEELNDRLTDDVVSFDPGPSSSLALDDAASGPFIVSAVLKSCLDAGTDHLHALKVLVLDAGVLHLAAPFSLARGALENYAAATWVLTGATRAERVARALRWHVKNLDDSRNATRDIDVQGEESLARRRALLDDVANRNDLGGGFRSGYSSTQAVKAAEAAYPDLRLGVVFPWRLCSGFAHGRPWAVHGGSEQQHLDGADPLMVTVRYQSSLTTVLYPTTAAVDLVKAFMASFDEHRT